MCKKEEEVSHAISDRAISSLKKYNASPGVIITKINGNDNADFAEKIRLKRDIKEELERVFQMIVDKDFSNLKSHVHEKSGLWVDLKSHKKYKDLDNEISNPESYLNVFFADTELLRLQTGEEDKLAVRDILLITDTVSAEVFVESNQEFEIKLNLDKAPKYNYYLNNPVFRFRNNRYYIYRLP